MQKNRPKLEVSAMVTSALLVAVSIVLTRFFSISTPTLRIGFGDVPVILSGMFFGPVLGALTGALADFIGFLINPMGSSYFPGFTLSAALRGCLPGIIFMMVRNKPIKVNYNVLSAFAVLSISIGFILSGKNSDSLNFFDWSLIAKIIYILTTVIFALLPIFVLKYKKIEEKNDVYSLDKILFVVTLSYITISIFLNTYWLSLLYGKAFMAMLPSRVITGLVIIPIHSIAIWFISKPLSKIKSIAK